MIAGSLYGLRRCLRDFEGQSVGRSVLVRLLSSFLAAFALTRRPNLLPFRLLCWLVRAVSERTRTVLVFLGGLTRGRRVFCVCGRNWRQEGGKKRPPFFVRVVCTLNRTTLDRRSTRRDASRHVIEGEKRGQCLISRFFSRANCTFHLFYK